MTPLAWRVLRTIRRHELLPRDSRVLAGVSGGSDSVALLHLLLELQETAGFRVSGVAHVHHGLRGEAADRDAEFCRSVAAACALPFHLEQVDVRGVARAERASLEEAARRLRAEALARAAVALSCDRVAIGHTRDDQAETVLLKLLRGAGTRGLRGIHPSVDATVRPLLEVGRDELRRWLLDRGLSFVDDETNADLRFRRNAVRHRVMPVLVDLFGPAAAGALARHADVAREDEALLTSLARPLADKAVRADESNIRIDCQDLASNPVALRRRVFFEALRAAGVREPGFEHVMQLVDLEPAAEVRLPGGIRAWRDGTIIRLGPVPAELECVAFRYVLAIPGSVWVAEAGRMLDARMLTPQEAAAESWMTSRTPSAAHIGADGLAGPLGVRNWRPGDAFRPLGLGGRKKLQDVFVDRKIPRADRSRVPLVVDHEDRIVWVPGHTVDEAYRVTGDTRAVVVLTVSESGGRE
jgi:tRNA(Ile)-lysidine synthase